MADEAKRSPESLAGFIELCRDYRALLLDFEYDDRESRIHARWAIGQIWHSLRARNIDPIPVEPDHDSLDRERALKAIDDVLRWATGQMPQPATGALPPYDPDALMGCNDLAAKFSVSPHALKNRLARWRKDHDDGWNELTPDQRNQPRLLYRVGAVIDVIREIRGQ